MLLIERRNAFADRYLDPLLAEARTLGLGPDDIAAMLGDPTASLEEICTRLVEAANAGGGPDNITALVLSVDVR